MSVKRCQEEIDSREFAEWMCFYELYPFGEERSDLRAGIVAATVANCHRGQNTEAFQPTDFMPKFGNESEVEIDDPLVLAEKIRQQFSGYLGHGNH